MFLINGMGGSVATSSTSVCISRSWTVAATRSPLLTGANERESDPVADHDFATNISTKETGKSLDFFGNEGLEVGLETVELVIEFREMLILLIVQ